MKTWRDIEEAALHDPFLQAAVAKHRMGATREVVLIEAALGLAAVVADQKERLVGFMMREPMKVKVD